MKKSLLILLLIMIPCSVSQLLLPANPAKHPFSLRPEGTHLLELITGTPKEQDKQKGVLPPLLDIEENSADNDDDEEERKETETQALKRQIKRKRDIDAFREQMVRENLAKLKRAANKTTKDLEDDEGWEIQDWQEEENPDFQRALEASFTPTEERLPLPQESIPQNYNKKTKKRTTDDEKKQRAENLRIYRKNLAEQEQDDAKERAERNHVPIQYTDAELALLVRRLPRYKQLIPVIEQFAQSTLFDSHAHIISTTIQEANFFEMLSPDGQFALIGCQDGSAHIRNVATRTVHRILNGHIGRVNSATFSPDGQFALTASNDGTARIWNVATGTVCNVLSGHTNWLRSAVFSPDGQFALTASNDGTARIWNVATGAVHHVLNGHTNWVRSAVFSPDGQFVLTASHDGTARIWRADTGTVCNVLNGHTNWVHSAVFSPDGQLALTASDDHTARVWDVATGTELHILNDHTNWVRSAVFSPDGQFVLTASHDGTARIWDVATGTVIHILNGHTRGIYRAHLSPDGRCVLTASHDGTARIWRADANPDLTTILYQSGAQILRERAEQIPNFPLERRQEINKGVYLLKSATSKKLTLAQIRDIYNRVVAAFNAGKQQAIDPLAADIGFGGLPF